MASADSSTRPAAAPAESSAAAPSCGEETVGQSFCSRGEECQRCGRIIGDFCGIRGFGLRIRGHERRCARRLGGALLPAGERSCGAPVPRDVAKKADPLMPKAEVESLGWVNALFAKMWPSINAAVQKIVHESVEPSIKEKLPSMVQSHFRFSKFTLGDVPPVLGPMEFEQMPNGVKLELGINLDSEVDIEIQCGASVGIKSLKFTGKLVVKLGPLLNESPIMGGVVAYFMDPPIVGLDFTGVGNIAEVPGLLGIVQGAINGAIAGSLVLPNVISVPIGTEEQGVDRALLSKPAPLGVLRVAALRANDLRGQDWHLTTDATSDPYVKVTLADRTWQSSTVAATCNPEWNDDDTQDFLVFDQDQHLSIEVYDQETIRSDKCLGRTKKLTVGETLVGRGDPLTLNLLPPEGEKITKGTAAKTCGTAQFRFDWFEMLPEGQLGAAGCVVVLQVEQIRVPRKLGGEAAVSLQIGDDVRSLPLVQVQQPAAASAAVDKQMKDMVKRCGESGMDHTTIAKVTQLTPDCIEEILKGPTKEKKPSQAKTASKKEDETGSNLLEVQKVFYFPISSAMLKTSAIEIKFMDKKQKLLGSASVDLNKSVVGADSSCNSVSSLYATDDSALTLVDKDGKEIKDLQAEIVVSLHGLQKTSSGSAPATPADSPVE